jgi:hypothetical protein
VNENHFVSESIHCMIVEGLTKGTIGTRNGYVHWTVPSGLLGRISMDEIFRR